MTKSKSAKKKAKISSLKAAGGQSSDGESLTVDLLSSQQTSSQSSLPPSPSAASFQSPIHSSDDPKLISTGKGKGKGKGKSSKEAPSSNITISTHTSSSTSMDDLAMELLMAKEAQSEVERLQNEVKRLKKESDFKDEIIAKLQAELAARSNTSAISSTSDAIASSNALIRSNTSYQPRDIALQCSICVDYFSSPYTVECGHTFCYTCLHSWLEIHKSCPTCRTKLLRRPTLSFNIREQVHSSLLRLPESERAVAIKKLQEDEDNVKRLLNQGDLWKDIFRPLTFASGSILDDDDGVRRCVSCGWEVAGGSCVNCNTLFSDAGESDDSQEHSDNISEPDQYDSHDSFINDDFNIQEEAWSNSDSNSEDSDEVPARKTINRRRQKKSAGLVRKNQTVFHISDDSDSELDRDRQVGSTSGGNNYSRSAFPEVLDDDDDDDDDDDLLQMNRHKSRQQKVRRALVVLDDDDDDEVEEHLTRTKKNNNNMISSPTKNKKAIMSTVTSTPSSSSSSISTSTSFGVHNLKRSGMNSKGNTLYEEISSAEDSDSDDDFVSSSTPRIKKRKTKMEDLFS
ncbi:E3 ubiquitin ligase [Entomortierella beljakovae]|nr:E3 ubiquitin ligase [Entomortierella beljakovae]